jgi:hypothetical protein
MQPRRSFSPEHLVSLGSHTHRPSRRGIAFEQMDFAVHAQHVWPECQRQALATARISHRDFRAVPYSIRWMYPVALAVLSDPGWLRPSSLVATRSRSA